MSPAKCQHYANNANKGLYLASGKELQARIPIWTNCRCDKMSRWHTSCVSIYYAKKSHFSVTNYRTKIARKN